MLLSRAPMPHMAEAFGLACLSGTPIAVSASGISWNQLFLKDWTFFARTQKKAKEFSCNAFVFLQNAHNLKTDCLTPKKAWALMSLNGKPKTAVHARVKKRFFTIPCSKGAGSSNQKNPCIHSIEPGSRGGTGYKL